MTTRPIYDLLSLLPQADRTDAGRLRIEGMNPDDRDRLQRAAGESLMLALAGLQGLGRTMTNAAQNENWGGLGDEAANLGMLVEGLADLAQGAAEIQRSTLDATA
jgi:hypothetical protein